MIGNPWTLVFFTLLSQTAFGLVVSLAVVSAGRQTVVRMVYDNVRAMATGMALLLMVAALLFSFFHLGSPEKAIYAVSNLRSSWLSREILMVSVFSGILLIWYITQKTAVAGEALNRFMLRISVLAGALMIYTMGTLYMVPTIPVWDSARTLVLFYSSGFLIGAPLLLAIIIPSYLGAPWSQVNYFFVPFLTIITVLSFLIRIPFIFFNEPAIENPAFPPADIHYLFYVTHYFLLTAGIALLTFGVFLVSENSGRIWKRYLSLSPVVIFTAELIGRYIFYSGYLRVGV